MSERRTIRELPETLVNRIAAGEVIERPASVVKELVENSIDAGATHIVVEVEDGGRELIRVIDDGCGIPPEQLGLAFASHATSKLVNDDDLFEIKTMGFRGEALASIGAVSHSRILSRTADADGGSGAGYEIYNRGGAISDPQAAAGNVGTTIEIRNLFFNTPARRKFMKGSSTEFGHIQETLLRTALPQPGVSFKLLHNGRVSMDLPAGEEVERWLAAWPEEFHEQRLPIKSRDAEVNLRGVIGLPECCKPTPKHQYFFLNGRPIRDKFIQHAVRESYRGLMEPGRYPAAILMLTVPPGDVDVNVHPTKAEVRFKDSGRIHGLVMAVLREKLLGSDLAPPAVPMRTDVDDRQRADMKERLAAFFKGSAAGSDATNNAEQASAPMLISPSPGTPDAAEIAGWKGRGEGQCFNTQNTWSLRSQNETDQVPINFSPSPQPSPARGEGEETSQRMSPLGSEGERPSPQPSPGVPGEGEMREPVSVPGEGGRAQPPATAGLGSNPVRLDPPTATPAIQLHNSYLVAESDDGLVIIDQHALHERIMFEELMARVMRGPLEGQRLLIPITLAASSRQMGLLEQIQPLLGRLGIEISNFGPETIAVQAFPSFLEKLDPAEFVRELLERGEQELLDLHEEELLHEILDMMACKAAVKAGDPLTQGEIAALLSRRELVERSSNCPHGRPTTLRLTLRDLEKQFKRTGF